MNTTRMVSLLAFFTSGVLMLGLAACSASDNGSTGTGGSAGSSGAGGTAGMGGSSGGGLITNMIDDFEDMDGRINNNAKQDGYWFTYNDGTGTQVPAAGAEFAPSGIVAGGANSSVAAGKSTGMGFTGYGAGVGVHLNTPGQGDAAVAPPIGLFDASAYSCLVFTAKSASATPNTVLVQLGTPSTISNLEPAGTCNGIASQCDNDYSASITLTADFKQHTVLFADMKQGSYGLMNAPGLMSELTKIVELHFQFNAPANATFDMTFDDVGFGTACSATQ